MVEEDKGMLNNNIVLIVPYFGKFPEWFDLWLVSCKYNPTITWLIFTDDHSKYQYPDNVVVNYTTFFELKTRIQNLYDMPIKLNLPYKLCDFKVAYGEIFQDEIKDFDYWGYCDVDLIWGNLRHFITDEVLMNGVKIVG